MQSSGSVHQPQFHCELRVPGFPCLGSGSASTKKEAQTVAAVKFCQQLVQAGHLQQADIPTTSPARWQPAGETDPTQSPSTSSASPATSPAPSAGKHSCKNELQFLHEFLGKAGCAGKVQFSYEQSGPVHQPVFQCRLAVPGYPDKARGSGGTKKAAQTAAAREFLTQQERAGKLEPGQIPGGESSQRQQLDRGSGRPGKEEEVVVGPGEGEDPSAELHGGWTLDNAKSYLNYFLQTHNLSMDYKYTMLGNTFVAEMQLWVRELNRSLAGRGTATTKLVASKSCALTLVRQLFHLKVVKAYAETVADKKEKGGSGDGSPWGRPVDVVVESGLLYRLEQHLVELGQPVQDGMPGPGPRPLTPSPYLPCPVSSIRMPPNTAVRWGPPEQGWDPWRTCTIQTHSLERQSVQLQQAAPRAATNLPVAAVREVLLQEVAANSVTLVFGATGRHVRQSQILIAFLNKLKKSLTSSHIFTGNMQREDDTGAAVPAGQLGGGRAGRPLCHPLHPAEAGERGDRIGAGFGGARGAARRLHRVRRQVRVGPTTASWLHPLLHVGRAATQAGGWPSRYLPSRGGRDSRKRCGHRLPPVDYQRYGEGSPTA